MTFADPQGDPLDALFTEAEAADAAYGKAADAFAVAKNAEDLAFYTFLASGSFPSAAAAEQAARAHTVQERGVRRVAEAVEESAKNHLRTVLARLSAAQTKFRSVERLAG